MRGKAYRWLGLLLGLVVLAWMGLRLYASRGDIDISWAQVSWEWVAVSFALLAFAYVLFAFAWHRLLAASDGSSWQLDLARWCVTLAGKYLPGKIWQGLARIGLYRGESGQAAVAPAYARELLSSLGAAMALVAVLAAFDPRAPAKLALPMALLALLAVMLALPPVAIRAARLVTAIVPASAWLQARAGRSGSVAVFVLQVVGYGALGLGLAALAAALRQPVEPGAMVAALCLGGVAGVAAFFVPAGIGVREAALAWYLTPHLGPAPATLLALASRAWLTLGEFFLVLAGLWWLQRKSGPRTPDP